jgi:hypothetical protein
VLFREGGEREGVDRLLASPETLAAALALYDTHRLQHPGRLVMLCDGARVVRRSDRPNRS